MRIGTRMLASAIMSTNVSVSSDLWRTVAVPPTLKTLQLVHYSQVIAIFAAFVVSLFFLPYLEGFPWLPLFFSFCSSCR